MNIYPATPENIQRAASLIREGGIVAFPTETVYGLGADATNALAVARIFEAKNRPSFDPLIVHIAEEEMAADIVHSFDESARKLAHAFWPGPLTLVLPKRDAVPDIVTAGLPTAALRMPDHEVARELIRQAGRPVAAPSANPFGYISPTTAAHVAKQLGDRVDMILDGGRCRVGVESTIVKLLGSEPCILRYGGLSAEEIETVVGPLRQKTGGQSLPEVPGELPYHYSPHTPIRIIGSAGDVSSESLSGVRAGLLTFRGSEPSVHFLQTEVLSPSGSLPEAASRFFEALHSLDEAGLDIIYAEEVPETGLGRAIMDRLRKAAARKKSLD